jgi:hypothetical protein
MKKRRAFSTNVGEREILFLLPVEVPQFKSLIENFKTNKK